MKKQYYIHRSRQQAEQDLINPTIQADTVFMSSPKRLYLIDGMAILFRGYYALISTPLSTASGEPTGGTFAFCSALVRLLEQHNPDLIAVAWDTPHPTFRHKQFTEYKSNRAAFPEALVPQCARVKSIVDLFKIPSLEMPGFEADDIIGTLARRGDQAGYDVYCVTPDKDYFQLVTERVKIYRPSKPSAPEQLIDIEGVRKRYGVSPIQVIDLLALIGDTSDNIPGVKGIGEKTAIPLIQEFLTVENLYENLHQVPKAGIRKKLEENRENAFMSKQLATIDVNLQVDVTFEQLHLDTPDYNGLLAVFAELGFKTLVSRYREKALAASIETPPEDRAESKPGIITSDNASAETAGQAVDANSTTLDFPIENLLTIADVDHEYGTIRSESELRTLVEKLKNEDMIAFDLETDSLDWADAAIVGISLSAHPGKGWYIPILNEETEITEDDGTLFGGTARLAATEGLRLDVVLRNLEPLLANAAIKKVGQNAKFDILMLRAHGFEVQGVAFDTMLASYVLDSTQDHNMDDLAGRHLGYKPVSITELIGTRGKGQLTMRDVPLDRVSEYAAEDADVTIRLYEKLSAMLDESGLRNVAEDLEFPLVEVLARMEYTGVAIDVPSLRDISFTLEHEAKRLEGEIHELAGTTFNIGSPKQLAEILFEQLKLPTKKKTKTGYSTDQFVMEELAALHPLPEKILEYRQAMKLKSTYVDALPGLINPKSGRIHTSYNQAVAATGRLSSNNPNLQNIPIRSDMGREIRKAFIPGISQGKILSADYSQIELRIMAHVSGDPELARAFREEEDIHTATAMRVFGVEREGVEANMRRRAKEVNFGIMYGIGPFGLARRLKIPQSEARELITAYFRTYPGVQEYITSTIDMARTKGYVETLSGRRRYYREIMASNHSRRSSEERAAVNMPIQGTASDIIKRAMIDIHRDLPAAFPNASMLLQVHDELVFEVPANEADDLAAFVKQSMENAYSLGDVPLVAETGIGDNWYEAH